ncbi:hypothetical protein [Streptomyces coffeae]|uniref:Uncharacterized protein n=1 Tax=Streptomyces coffeae TaxID=621382 RepID=A0ABS1NKE9_9ACTN|nr:hypothetical protein [Streptomyces coffeae]MBL1100577.1 hypothetical protein [Streptomyces coffeae]
MSSLASRIAGFPAETIAPAKASLRIPGSIEDALVQEEEEFHHAAHSAPAKRRMAAALAMGMQTPAMERCCFTHVWGPLAGA